MFFSLFLYITIGTFTMCMSGIRQSLAMVIVLFAVCLLLQKKIFMPVMLILLASTIHVSAIVAFIFLPLSRLRISRMTAGIMIVLCSAALIYKNYLTPLLILLAPKKYAGFSFDNEYQINSLLIVISIIIPVFCLIFMNRTEADGKYSNETSLWFMMSFMNILFTILTINNNQVGRLTYYFANANAVLIPTVVREMGPSNRRIVLFILIPVCLIYFYLGTKGGTLQIDNYMFFWQA